MRRRNFLALSLSTALAPQAWAATLAEAPALAALVKAGKLPKLAERLPQQPEVVTPVANVGKHGGILRNALAGDADHNAILRIVGNMGLTRWSPDFQKPVPNVAAGWDESADARSFTFKLRPGMKWSDGHPFTADDILFCINDLLANKEFFAVPPSQYVVAGKLVTATKQDDHTVTFHFAEPYRIFPEVLAGPLGQHPVLYAKHYCQQFVPKYNPGVANMVADSHQPNWASLFRAKCGDIEVPARWANPERPVLDPWVVERGYTGGTTEVTMRRNPYFWQVDTAGNQLPYIDGIDFKVVSNEQSMLLAVIGGQIDLQLRYIPSIGNKPILAQHADKAGYVLQPLTPTDANAVCIYLNQTDKDEKLKGLLTNKTFRIALSHAMDRDSINEIVFLGQSKPWQVAPLPGDSFYNEQLATQYLKFDPKKANELLDSLGLKRSGTGPRTYPDGSKLFLTVDVMVNETAMIDTIQMVKKQWADVGIDLGINTMERSQFYNRGQDNAYDIDLEAATGGVHPTTDPRAWLAVHQLDSRQSIPWVQWYTSGGKLGIAPSASMQERLKLWDQWKQTADQAAADALVKKILQMAADAFETIGTVQALTVFGIRSKRLMNVPASMPNGWTYPNPAPTLPQQYYFTDA
ncbi:MAG: ABC transporter substrate-binding protein [Rhodospirillales bacterium]|nr:ABC transporter substrate-binding protein [Rhodospirillales bacterium]